MEHSTPKRRGLHFGLRSVFLAITVICLGAGLYVARQNRVAAANRRFETLWGTLEALVRKPFAGSSAPSSISTSQGGTGAPGTRSGSLQWQFAVNMIDLALNRDHSTAEVRLIWFYRQRLAGW